MEIRSATPDDYDAYVNLFGELGVDDPVPSRERFAAEIVARVLIASDGSEVVGYALFEQLAEVGYVRNLVSSPAHRRAGIGRALMDAMRERFVARGAHQWCLNVKPDNAAAIALYRACGLAPAYRSWALRLPRAAALPAMPPELGVTPLAPDEDQAVETRFGLMAGQLASSRTRASRHVLALRRGQEVAGVGVFSTTIPGAFPFRVVNPALAAPFAAHLRTLAPADAPYVQLGVEDDVPLADALRALGAHVHLEILHMRGPLRA